MAGQIVELTHHVNECQNSAQVFVRPHPKTPLSAALAHVFVMVGLYENEFGFPDSDVEQVEFDDFVTAFGQYRNGINDRGDFALCINSHTILNDDQEAAMEKVIPLIQSITVINPDETLQQLFNYIKDCMNNGFDVDSHDILGCNQPISKAIIIMRDLVRAEHTEWTDEAEAKFIEEFGE